MIPTMTALIRLIESSSHDQSLAFAENMISACSAAQMGFHFDEGGCWGMALALYDYFRSVGHNPQIIVGAHAGEDSHAMVRVDGKLYDHQGETTFNGTMKTATPHGLLKRAEACGYDEDTVLSDKDAAEVIIKNAVTEDWSKWDWENQRWTD